MTEAVGHDRGMNASPQSNGRVRVTEIVETYPGQPRGADRLLEDLTDPVGMPGGAIFPGKYQTGVGPNPVPVVLLLLLSLVPCTSSCLGGDSQRP